MCCLFILFVWWGLSSNPVRAFFRRTLWTQSVVYEGLLFTTTPGDILGSRLTSVKNHLLWHFGQVTEYVHVHTVMTCQRDKEFFLWVIHRSLYAMRKEKEAQRRQRSKRLVWRLYWIAKCLSSFYYIKLLYNIYMVYKCIYIYGI